MKIDGSKIASFLRKLTKKEIKNNSLTNLKLVVVTVGNKGEQDAFVRAKEKEAKRIGVKFELLEIKRVPLFEKFVRKIRQLGLKKENTAIIIQQPLPMRLSTNTIYKFIPLVKEIEGYMKKSPYTPPIGQAVITILKYIYMTKGEIDERLLPVQETDKHFFKSALKNKNVLLIGRGITGGLPIGKTLTNFKINYINISSHTPNKERYIKSADVIISAVGKKMITAENIKKGVALINIGLRKEDGKYLGDYDEEEIKDVASFYTPVRGGTGPLNVAYLFRNLVKAAILARTEPLTPKR